VGGGEEKVATPLFDFSKTQQARAQGTSSTLASASSSKVFHFSCPSVGDMFGFVLFVLVSFGVYLSESFDVARAISCGILLIIIQCATLSN
jgi:hypothetical protein